MFRVAVFAQHGNNAACILLQAGASSLEQEGSTYLRAVFEQDAGPLSALGVPTVVDDVEFLFPDDNDTRVRRGSSQRGVEQCEEGKSRQQCTGR